MGEPVRHGKESSNGGYVPGVLAVKARFLQRFKVLLCDGVAATHSHGKVQHGTLPRGQVSIFIVHNDLEKTEHQLDLQVRFADLWQLRKTKQEGHMQTASVLESKKDVTGSLVLILHIT